MPRPATGRKRPNPIIVRWDDRELSDLHNKAATRSLKVEPYIRSLVARDRPKGATMTLR